MKFNNPNLELTKEKLKRLKELVAQAERDGEALK